LKVLQLNGRNQDLSDILPKKYRGIILNSILAKSVDSGILFKELSLYLHKSELEELALKLDIKITPVKAAPVKTYKKPFVPKVSDIESKGESLFIGFDD